MFRTIDITYDITTNQVIGGIASLYLPADTPYFVFPETVLVRMSVYSVAPLQTYTAYTGFSDSDLYSATLNIDYDPTTQNLAKANDDLFNSTTDWALANPAAGRLCFKLSLDTDEMYTALGAAMSLTNPYLEITVRKQNDSYLSTIVRIPVSVLNDMGQFPLTALTLSTDFSGTAPSTSTITMLTDQTANIAVGAQVRVQYASTYHFTTVQAITSGLLTLTESTLPLTAGAIQAVAYQPASALGSYYSSSTLVTALSGKQPKDLTATAGDFAIFNASGSTVTAGQPLPDFATTYYRVFRTGTINFKMPPSYHTVYTVPTGHVFCIDTVEPVIHSITGYSGQPSIGVGNVANPTEYLAATPFTKTLAGERQVITVDSPAVPAGTEIKTLVQVATASTTMFGYMLVKGYLIPI